jgi:hypothetical protein
LTGAGLLVLVVILLAPAAGVARDPGGRQYVTTYRGTYTYSDYLHEPQGGGYTATYDVSYQWAQTTTATCKPSESACKSKIRINSSGTIKIHDPRQAFSGTESADCKINGASSVVFSGPAELSSSSGSPLMRWNLNGTGDVGKDPPVSQVALPAVKVTPSSDSFCAEQQGNIYLPVSAYSPPPSADNGSSIGECWNGSEYEPPKATGKFKPAFGGDVALSRTSLPVKRSLSGKASCQASEDGDSQTISATINAVVELHASG